MYLLSIYCKLNEDGDMSALTIFVVRFFKKINGE